MVDDDSLVGDILKSLGTFNSKNIKVGIIGDSGTYKKSQATVLDVANRNEFGTSRIPERSFIRATYDKKLPDIEYFTTKVLTETIENTGDATKALLPLGKLFAGWTQETLRDLTSPPNSPVTIKLKGSSSPLIDTGQLVNSITFEVV